MHHLLLLTSLVMIRSLMRASLLMEWSWTVLPGRPLLLLLLALEQHELAHLLQQGLSNAPLRLCLSVSSLLLSHLYTWCVPLAIHMLLLPLVVVLDLPLPQLQLLTFVEAPGLEQHPRRVEQVVVVDMVASCLSIQLLHMCPS